MSNKTKTGKLIGVGVGPGDPELMSLKAIRCIAEADVIAYPAAKGIPSFARSIAAEYIRDDHIEHAIEMPMKIERFPAQDVYAASAEFLSNHLNARKNVVVLCEGDPFFYGSFMYLFGRMAHEFDTEIVPGISSLTACAAASQLPLSARNDVLCVLPGPLSDEELELHFQHSQAFVIPKVGQHLGRLKRLLERHNLLHKAMYIERASLPNQVVMPLKNVRDDKAPYFSMILFHVRGNAYDG